MQEELDLTDDDLIINEIIDKAEDHDNMIQEIEDEANNPNEIDDF